MSRHQLNPRDHTTREAAVGWDSRTGTFYALVISHANTILVDRGTPEDRIYRPELVLDAIRPYAVIPDGLGELLMREALTDTRRTS